MKPMSIDTDLAEFIENQRALCPKCDYALQGLTKPICPECGSEITLRALHQGRSLFSLAFVGLLGTFLSAIACAATLVLAPLAIVYIGIFFAWVACIDRIEGAGLEVRLLLLAVAWGPFLAGLTVLVYLLVSN
jgi:uncharacterized protein (DUF983 family)